MSPLRRRILAAAVAAIGIVPAVRDARASDTADSLLADLPRLAFVQEGCKADAPWATEALCRAAAQAIRRRFHGEGVPYTPRPVEPFPDRVSPAPASPAPASPTLPSPAPAAKPEPHARPSAGAALLS